MTGLNKGSRNGSAKLTEEDVIAIRARRADGERGSDLAREFGVDRHTIKSIVLGYTWGWLPQPGDDTQLIA
jgi:hypothetical protein